MTNSILTDKRKIVAPPEAEYMSHFMTDLPDYTCYFNKTLCGVGGTSLVLANDIPYIILVPYVSLVEGKLNQTNEDGTSAHLTFITDKLIPNKRIKTDTIALDLLGNDVKSQLRFLKSNKVDNGKKPIKITQEILDIINNI